MYGSSNSNGWTVTIVGLFIIGFVAMIFAKCSADLSGHARDTAQAEANKWLKSMGINGKAQCADRDTDGDDYVSCTLVVTDKNGATHIEPMECAGSLTINSGCRSPKAVVRGAQ